MRVIENEKLRGALRILIPFVLIPVAVLVGTLLIGQKRHLLVSLIVAVLAIVLFIAGFEKKEIGTRRMVIVAVMVALSIVGRFIPFFKPITAITVLTAVYIGKEAGFTVGAMSALLSNFYFGQGPWTPFQMLAWGLIGLFAGALSGVLKKSRIALVCYGALSGLAYSLVMDLWTVLWYNGSFSFSLYLASVTTALPHTVLYAVSNTVFLWLMAKPFGEKLERIKIKYGV